MHAILQPWSHGFMQRALLELVFVGVVGAVLGCWIVLYELAYSAESLAHALFPGLVVAALIGLPLLLGAAGGVLAAAAGVALAGRLPGIGRDVAVAIVVTTLFGLGVLLALTPASPPGLDALLFGDLLGVTRGDLVAAGSLAAVSLVALAALIGPAATARALARRVPTMMLAATGVAVGCAVAGLYVSYYVDVAAGASVAGTTVVAYLALRPLSAARARRAALRRRRRPGRSRLSPAS